VDSSIGTDIVAIGSLVMMRLCIYSYEVFWFHQQKLLTYVITSVTVYI